MILIEFLTGAVLGYITGLIISKMIIAVLEKYL